MASKSKTEVTFDLVGKNQPIPESGPAKMHHSKIVPQVVFSIVAVLSVGGCLCDSIEPWLQSDSVMKRDLFLEGDWEIINDDQKDKYSVRLEKKKDPRSIDQQSYYINISPREFRTQFNFSGVVHELNNIKLLQITNFTHYHNDVFSLANRPTVSLWQIAYDEDNIILWAPRFLVEDLSNVKTMKDSDDKHLFIDSTDNLQEFLNNWTRGYPIIKEEIRNILPIILTRSGTEFAMPEELRDLVPKVYESYLKSRGSEGDGD